MSNSEICAAEQAYFLTEMGIGPLWQLRHTQAEATLDSSKLGAAPINAIDADSHIEQILLPTIAPGFPASSASDSEIDLPPIALNAKLTWGALESAVSSCQACTRCNGRTNVVFGAGDVKARWLFISDAPSRDKTLTLPLRDNAARLFDNMLRALGLGLHDGIYLTSLVKCQPADAAGFDQTKSRIPESIEIAACLPFLQQQISLLQPEVIVSLGSTAAIALVEDVKNHSFDSLRGQIFHHTNIPLLVTHDLDTLLTYPEQKRQTWEDLCLALSALN